MNAVTGARPGGRVTSGGEGPTQGRDRLAVPRVDLRGRLGGVRRRGGGGGGSEAAAGEQRPCLGRAAWEEALSVRWLLWLSQRIARRDPLKPHALRSGLESRLPGKAWRSARTRCHLLPASRPTLPSAPSVPIHTRGDVGGTFPLPVVKRGPRGVTASPCPPFAGWRPCWSACGRFARKGGTCPPASASTRSPAYWTFPFPALLRKEISLSHPCQEVLLCPGSGWMSVKTVKKV